MPVNRRRPKLQNMAGKDHPVRLWYMKHTRNDTRKAARATSIESPTGGGARQGSHRTIGHRAANGNGVSKFAGPTLAPAMKELTFPPMAGNPTVCG
ncbi:hypothetical protein PPUJ20188_36570 [Pseudomonas putida]|nr:hypothetical protein PPUJ20188_36570 [Pseudomonas putida]